MFWLAKPPYFRRILGVLILLLAVAWEFRPTPTELRPFLARDVEAGDQVADDDLEWRSVPVGFLPEYERPEGQFLVDGERGSPLLASMVGEPSAHPEDWWSLVVPIPEGTQAGVEVRLVVDVRTSPRAIPGIVVRPLGSDSLGEARALVAIPEAEVGAAAAALADGSLQTLIGSN